MKQIKVFMKPTIAGSYVWNIVDIDEDLEISSIIAIGTENTAEKAFAAAFKRYNTMNTIDNPYENCFCDKCYYETESHRCIKHILANEYVICKDITSCRYFKEVE